MDVWSKCIEKSKKKLGVNKYGFIKGPVFKDAQKAYCAVTSQGALK
jgi:hypothetical protein